MLLNSKWLTYATGEYKGMDAKYGNPSPYFRKAFSIEKPVKKASLKIAVIGVFKAYINGCDVSEEFLSPPWVDYTKKIPLMEYDITDKIVTNNVIGVVLGDGWAVGHVGSTATFKRNSFNDTLWFSAEVHLLYADGTSAVVGTDENWKATSGEILYNDIYMGEYIDHNKSLGDFSKYGYDDLSWSRPEVDDFRFTKNLYLTSVDIPPIRTKHVFEPKIVSQTPNSILYDVGQNIAGVLRLRLNGEMDSKVVARHGEILVDGKLYTDNLRKAEAMDTFVLTGYPLGEEFRPIFTYHGFRYFELQLFGNVKVEKVIAEAMYTDLNESGAFECSNEIVNKIFQNTLWSQRDNFYGVPTDCPQRDERLGWTGDAQIFCNSAMYNMDCKKFFEKYLSDIRDAQLGNGVIPVVAPLPRIGFRTYSGYDAAAGWSEAIAIIPYLHYKMYGDVQVIKDNIFACKQLLKYYLQTSDGFIRNGEDARYGDWLNVDSVTDLTVVATLYFAYAARLTALMCYIINDSDSDYYAGLFNNIGEAFVSSFINESGVIKSDTQTAYLLAYKFGLISAECARTNLVRKLAEDNGHLTSGFLGIKYLLPTLCDLGLVDNAYDILTSTGFPGWGYSIVNGATTIWEHWDSNSIERLSEMNSFNHYSLGSCVEWMYEYCLGIRPNEDEGGFKKLILKPYIDITGKLDYAKGYYNTPYGRLEIEWRKENDGYVYSADVPNAINVSFSFPRMVEVAKKISKQQNTTKTSFLLTINDKIE